MQQSEMMHAIELINTVDLEMVIMRLVKIEHWSLPDAKEAVTQYRKYLILRRKYPGETLPPSKDIDEVWHAHILHTVDYRTFCKQAFSDHDDQYLDHHPHIANVGNVEKLTKLFEKTQGLYKQEFGEYIYQITGRSFIRRQLDKLREYLIKRFPKLADDLA